MPTTPRGRRWKQAIQTACRIEEERQRKAHLAVVVSSLPSSLPISDDGSTPAEPLLTTAAPPPVGSIAHRYMCASAAYRRQLIAADVDKGMRLSPEDVVMAMQDVAVSSLGLTQPDMQMNYADYQKIRQTLQSRIGSQADVSLSATSFWLCQGKQEGIVEWSSMTNYMLEKLTALRTLKYLMRFDTLGSGFLSKDGLTRFLQSVFAESEFLVDSDAAAKGLFVQVFVQKVEFLIGRIGMEKYRLTELACSSVMAEVMQMARASHRDERSWAIAVRNILDRVKALWENFSQAARSDKMVVEKSAFVSQADRPLTDIFIERMFAEHTQSRDEMSFCDYLKCIFAQGNRNSRASISYHFRILDIFSRGAISHEEIYMFFRDINSKMVQNGNPWLDPYDVIQEIYDMVVPSTPLITLQDLLDSKIGGTVCGILTNVREFWLYDNREALQHEEETDDD